MAEKDKFDGRYSPSNLDKALFNVTNQKPFVGQLTTSFVEGNLRVKVPYDFYKNDQMKALIIPSSTDIQNGATTTIFENLTTEKVKDEIKNCIKINQMIIIPVAEDRKILGFIPRKHWVTLCYDPANNIATIIDSKSRWRSFLYPTKSMITMLKQGLTQACLQTADKDKPNFNEMKVNKISTGAQKDDIHCGAWTVQHIQDIASCGQVSPPNYTEKDRDTVVKRVAELANLELIPKKSLLARLFAKIFESRSKTADAAVSSAPQPNKKPDGHFEVDDSYCFMQNNGLGTSITGKTPNSIVSNQAKSEEDLGKNSTEKAGSDAVKVNPHSNNTPRF